MVLAFYVAGDAVNAAGLESNISFFGNTHPHNPHNLNPPQKSDAVWRKTQALFF